MDNFDRAKIIYFIGIKGVAMSGLAVICQQLGKKVLGSDVESKFITDQILEKNNIEVFSGFDQKNLDCRPDMVVVGTSWGKDNVEVSLALSLGIPQISDSKLRGILSRKKRTIAVTGVHGKTTTTAIIAHLFNFAGLKPSFLIGTGIVPDLSGNAAWSEGRHFIVEGDEYAKSKEDKSPKFSDLDPSLTVITSLEWEHVDVFRDLAIMEDYFSQLIDRTREKIVACGDWESIRKIAVPFREKVITYGFDQNNDWQAYNIRTEPSRTIFNIKNREQDLGEFEIKLFGRHNALNCLAATIIAISEGISLDSVKKALAGFTGTQRRFEVSDTNGITFVDDYAHHPTEIKTTLQAIRDRYPKKNIICVFQPHTVTRTKALINDFAQCFSAADQVIIADIFASAREQSSDFTSQNLLSEVAKFHSNASYGGKIAEIVDSLSGKIKSDDVLVTMGAGDVYLVRDKLISVN